MQIERVCPVCGRTFITTRRNTVYCSATCRMQGYRHKLKDDADAEELERETAARDEEKRADDARKKAKRQRMKKAAAKGDPFAIMITVKPFSREYWQAYKAAELKYCEECGETSTRTVNGIPVTADDFAERAEIAVHEAGIIIEDAYGAKEG